MGQVLSEPIMKQVVEEMKAHGKKIVFTNGVFDILHTGHLKYLSDAKRLGDVLIVGVNTDASVKSYKGPKRPIVPEKERAEMLSHLNMVDFVVLFSDRLPSRLIGELKPDIHVKGGDYKVEDLPEAAVVKAYGGEVQVLPLYAGSTSQLINRIVDRYVDEK